MIISIKKIKLFIKGLNMIYLVIPILTLIFVSIITYKSLTYKSKIDTYEEYFTVIESKESNTVDLNYESDFNLEETKQTEVNEYINCLNKRLTFEELNESVKLSMRTLENLFNQSYNYFSFKYTDIYTGFTVSYNENQEIFTASTIKAPMAIYMYEQAEKNLINLDEKLTYTPSYYNSGSGILKNKEFNQSYSTRELISYAISHSDNAAHNMLMDKYGRENMYNFWKEKGTFSIFKQYSNWGVTNANDATIYMKELYDYYNTDSEYAKELMSYFKGVTFKQIKNKEGKTNTINKAGWSGSAFHDVAIVYENNPYILVILSNIGYNENSYLFNFTSKVVGELHEEYWNLKYNKCQEIINR